MPVVSFLERVAGAVAGAASRLMKARVVILFDTDHFDVDDYTPTSPIQTGGDSPGIASSVTRIKVRAGAGGNVPETRTFTGNGDVLIASGIGTPDTAPHDLSEDLTFSTSATPVSTPAKIVRRDDNARTGLAGVTVGAAQTWIYAHTAHASADGADSSWTGQAAATGAFEGGGWTFAGGDRGDSDHWAGGFSIALGPRDDNEDRSAYFSLYETNPASPFARFYSGSGQLVISSANVMNLVSGDDMSIFTTGALGFTLGTKPTVTGSRGGNAALQSLLSALATYGLITDSTS